MTTQVWRDAMTGEIIPDFVPQPSRFGKDIIGRQPVGFPGAKITAVDPTTDYLINGPVGDGWYEPSEKRYVTTDFQVTVLLADGREVVLPKSYDWVTNGLAKGAIL